MLFVFIVVDNIFEMPATVSYSILTAVKVATIQQKNVCHPSLSLQKLDTSSKANSRPPTGAPNAALTPAPAPAVRKFLLKSEELGQKIKTVDFDR